ncbi:hypothetical protein Tco_1340100, partial [Tanacetum coccineum]
GSDYLSQRGISFLDLGETLSVDPFLTDLT